MSRRGLALTLGFVLEADKLHKKAGRQLPYLTPLKNPPPGIPFPEYDIRTKLRLEREGLGFYVSGHPLDHAQGRSATPLRPIQENPDQAPGWLDVLGVVSEAETRRSSRGNTFTKFVVEDDSGGAVSAIAFGSAAGLPSEGHVARIRGPLRIERPEVDGEEAEGIAPNLLFIVTKAENYTLLEEW